MKKQTCLKQIIIIFSLTKIYFVAGNDISCLKCGRRYTHRCTLQRHIKYECGLEPQFSCSLCPLRSKQRGIVLRHMRLKHPDQCAYEIISGRV